MIYYVAGETKEEVALGKGAYIVSSFSKALHEVNEKVYDLVQKKVKFEEIDVLVLSTEGSSSHPEELTKKLGVYYKYLFLNEAAKQMVLLKEIECNIIGEINEKELPSNVITLFRSKWFKPKI